MPNPATALLTVMLALATAGLGARVVVPRLGDAMARRVAHLAAAVSTRTDETEAAIGPEPDPVLAPAEPPVAPPPPTHRRADKAASGGALDIPADRIAHLTEKQLRSLGATDAVGKDGRAIGARLQGVGALGVGLADGDVVTTIDGSATPDVTTATAAAMRAYASGETTVHATVLRNGHTLLVTVHVPAKRPSGRRA